MAPLLELINVCKHFKVKSGMFGLQAGTVRAVDGVSLTVKKGETLGLVGESGCGKSTLAKCIMGLERVTSGAVAFNGKELSEWDEKQLRSHMQMVFQDPYSSLDPRQKIGSIIREGLDIHNIGSRDERQKKVAIELLRLVGLREEHGATLPPRIFRRPAATRGRGPNPGPGPGPHRLRRAGVRPGRVRAGPGPRPAQGLAEAVQPDLRVFISHDLSVVSHISDNVAVMYLGRIMEIGPSKTLVRRPQTPLYPGPALGGAASRPDHASPSASP